MTNVQISIVNRKNGELRACLRALPAGCEGTTWHTTAMDNVSGDDSLQMLAVPR